MKSANDLNLAGIELHKRGDFEGARLHYEAALKVDAFHTPALQNLAEIEHRRLHLATNVVMQRRLIALNPHDVNRYANLANCLSRLERYDEAEAALKVAVELGPDQPAVWHNLALLYIKTLRYTDALAALDKVQALGVNGHQVLNDRAHALLGLGRLPEALADYEARWHTLVHLPPWDFYIPEWRGEDLDRRRILVHAEQGYGDTIMTSRFLRDLSSRYPSAEITFGIPACMTDLFSAQPWCPPTMAIEMMCAENIEGRFDFQSPLYGMMRHLGIDLDDIHPDPYLTNPETLILGDADHRLLNVGICWASGRRFTDHDQLRRISDLKDWLPLAELPHVRLWSLQKGTNEEEIAEIGAESLIVDIPVRNWADTATIISNLDLVVSIDSAVAHLSGALGKPTWVPLQFTQEWRWWNVPTGLPWYSKMEMFVQPSPGDWKAPLSAIAARIRDGEALIERLAA